MITVNSAISKYNVEIARLEDRKIALLKENSPLNNLIYKICLYVFSIFSAYCKETINLYNKNFDEMSAVDREKEQIKNEKLKCLETWKSLRLTNDVDVDVHFGQMKKLINTRLIWWITGFQSVSAREKKNHPIVVKGDQILIKKEGKLVSVDSLDIHWEKRYDTFCDSKGKKWLYLSPNGLEQLDKNVYSADDMRPILQLSKYEMKNVLKQGAKFFDPVRHPDPHPEEPKVAAVQFITRPNPSAVENMPIVNRITKDIPFHVGVRIISADGGVYSTSISMKPEDAKDYNIVDCNTLKVRNASISRIDWEEFLPKKDGEVITTIPLSEKSFNNVFLKFQDQQRTHLRFSATKQNCIKFAENTANFVGEKVSTDVKMKQVIGKLLPSISDIPCIGKKIEKLGRRVVQKLDTLLPDCIKNAFILLGKILYFPIDLATTFLMNLVLLCAGNGQANPTTTSTDRDAFSKEEMNNYKRTVNSPLDLFSSESELFYHAGKFADWQLDQGSTFVFDRHTMGSKMNFSPKTQQKQPRRERFENIYQEMGKSRRSILKFLQKSQEATNLFEGYPNLYKSAYQSVKENNLIQLRQSLLQITKIKKSPLESSIESLNFFSKWKEVKSCLTPNY